MAESQKMKRERAAEIVARLEEKYPEAVCSLEWAKDPDKKTELVPKNAVAGKFICRNRRCISNMEVGVESLFRPSHDCSGGWRCVYCESKPR